ncbi:hypothetical protein RCH27_08305 [Paracidovorax citrulli]|uniref:hypothetical protein n=1 Tax=Paracidovorax citrulli TaxID=80869 RepID=UPI003A809958
MSAPAEHLAESRARASLPDALRAAARARDLWWQQRQTHLRCASCGAPITHRPAEGQGLPCGH